MIEALLTLERVSRFFGPVNVSVLLGENGAGDKQTADASVEAIGKEADVLVPRGIAGASDCLSAGKEAKKILDDKPPGQEVPVEVVTATRENVGDFE